MTLLTPSKSPLPERYGIPPFPVSRFTVEQYHQMISTGMFEDARVELLDGWITPKMTHNPPHDSSVTRCQRKFQARLGSGWCVRTQCAVTLAESEPEPDVAVAIGPDERYDDHHPGPAELMLVVEVAESSLDTDREIKATLYAAASIPVYWIVNLIERQVEVYSDPTGPAAEPCYRSRRIYHSTDAIPLDGFDPGLEPINVADLLPRIP